MKHTQLLLLATFMSLFLSCSDDDSPTLIPEPGAYESGILISNEGPFASGSGSVTFIENDLNSMEQNIYFNVNNDNVGNVLNSIGFYNDKAYLVANVSNSITVVNRYTFEKESVIQTGLDNPRFFTSWNNVGFVTNWGDPNDNEDDYIAVIDLISEEIISNIPVAFGPEKILVAESLIYVAHKGAYGHNNLISVINPATSEVIEELEVGDVPGAMVLDSKGSLWVLCEGIPAWTGNETNGSLVQIERSNNHSTTFFDFGTGNHPQFLSGDAGFLYYSLNGSVYTMSETANELPLEPQVTGVYFYNLEVKDGILYGLDAKDFASNGSVEIYDLYNGNTYLKSIETGIIPGGIYFNEN